jgi:hypothetical protein
VSRCISILLISTIWLLAAVSGCKSKSGAGSLAPEPAKPSDVNRNGNPSEGQEHQDKPEQRDDGHGNESQKRRILLLGAFFSDEQKLDPRIDVNLSRSGERERDSIMRGGFVKMESALPSHLLSGIQSAKYERTYLNIGCDVSQRTEVSGLREGAARRLGQFETIIRAKVVLICGSESVVFETPAVLVEAETVVLSNARIELVGPRWRHLAIVAENLVIEDKNFLFSKTTGRGEGPATAPGSWLSLAAVRIAGTGNMEIIYF